MNEAAHFAKLKAARRQRMSAVRNIERDLTNSNGSATKGLQGNLHVHLPAQLPFWVRVRETLRRSLIGQGWERVVVNKSVDSITMPKWIASSILGAVLLFGVSSWWRASDQRDMLIELKTELRLAKERETEKSIELRNQANLNKVYIDNMTNQLNVIKGMLSQQQQNAVEELRKGNN